MDMDIEGRLTCQRTSPDPTGPILDSLEDPNGGRGVHRLGTATGL